MMRTSLRYSLLSSRTHSGGTVSFDAHRPSRIFFFTDRRYSHHLPPPPPPHNVPYFHFNRTQIHQGSSPHGIGSRQVPLFVEIVTPQRSPMYRKLMGMLGFTLFFGGVLYFLTRSFTLVIGFEDANEDPKAVSGLSSRSLSSMLGNQEVAPVNLDSFDVTFRDIRGCDEAKEELEDIVLFLKNPDRFRRLGGKLPKGALLVGPPGCGKTMLAKAIAKESGVHFYYCAGSEFDEMFVGVGARRIRDLFRAAKSNGPALIFIDEIDAVGGSRTSKDMGYTRMTLNQLLSEMDGFISSGEIIVLAATNTPETLDKALTRPGRFDRIIHVEPPDMLGRVQILDAQLSKIQLETNMNIHDTSQNIARSTTGFTGADLQNVVHAAAIRAALFNKNGVSLNDFEYAIDRVMMGAENHTKKMSPKEKEETAYHEGGHALVALSLQKKGADPVHKATIVPRGNGVLGLVQQVPETDRYSMSRAQMMTRLTIALAGRAAEDVVLGGDHVTSGAASDFSQATKLATTMVRRFGWNEGLGLVDYESSETNRGAFLSEKTKQEIEEQVRELLMVAYATARDILVQQRKNLDRIATALIEFETLSGDELKRIIQDPNENLRSIFSEMVQNGKLKSSNLAMQLKEERDRLSSRSSTRSSTSAQIIPVQIKKSP